MSTKWSWNGFRKVKWQGEWSWTVSSKESSHLPTLVAGVMHNMEPAHHALRQGGGANREEKRARNTCYWCHQVNNLWCTDNIFKKWCFSLLRIRFASTRTAQHGPLHPHSSKTSRPQAKVCCQRHLRLNHSAMNPVLRQWLNSCLNDPVSEASAGKSVGIRVSEVWSEGIDIYYS